MLNFWELGAFGSYARYGHRLPLTDLAYGDPTAPTANIYRWNATVAGVPQPGAARSAGAAPRSGHAAASPASRRSIRRSSGRTWTKRCSASTRARARAPSCASPRSAGREARLSRRRRRRARVDLHDDRRSRPRHRRRRRAGRSDPDLLQPIAGDLRRRSLPADQPGRRRRVVRRRRHDRPGAHAEVLLLPRPDRGARRRAIAANRGFGPLENDAGVVGEAYVNPNALRARAGTHVHRARLHHQDRGDLHLPARHRRSG